jgi:hypothetical protein
MTYRSRSDMWTRADAGGIKSSGNAFLDLGFDAAEAKLLTLAARAGLKPERKLAA